MRNNGSQLCAHENDYTLPPTLYSIFLPIAAQAPSISMRDNRGYNRVKWSDGGGMFDF
jgi:hypothetical protein